MVKNDHLCVLSEQRKSAGLCVCGSKQVARTGCIKKRQYLDYIKLNPTIVECRANS